MADLAVYGEELPISHNGHYQPIIDQSVLRCILRFDMPHERG